MILVRNLVVTFVLLLLLIISALICLQHACNHVQVLFLDAVQGLAEWPFPGCEKLGPCYCFLLLPSDIHATWDRHFKRTSPVVQLSLAETETYLSMYCVTLTYATAAASSPSMCTCGFTMLTFWPPLRDLASVAARRRNEIRLVFLIQGDHSHE